MRLQFPESLSTSDALASAALLLVLLAARLIAGRTLRNRENLTDQATRRWTANVRNFLILIAVAGLFLIWAPQLRAFALSLTAVAIAIVVATKELILCLSGAALRTFTRAFSVGDVVEIGTTKGEVLDLNLLAARLSEFDPREGSISPTGRTIILPYSLLFSSPVKVLSHSENSVPHRFAMTFEADANIFALRPQIEDVVAKSVAGMYPGGANSRRQGPGGIHPAGRKNGLSMDFSASELGKNRVSISLLVPPEAAQRTENEIACAIGSLVNANRDRDRHADPTPSAKRGT